MKTEYRDKCWIIKVTSWFLISYVKKQLLIVLKLNKSIKNELIAVSIIHKFFFCWFLLSIYFEAFYICKLYYRNSIEK